MTFAEETTPERRQVIVDTIASKLMPEIRTLAIREGQKLAAEWGVSEHLAATWIAEVLGEGISTLRDWEAGEAEAAGESITDIAAALELTRSTNYRRKAPTAKKFAEARRASQLTGVTVPITVNQWKIEITPRTKPSR